MSWIYLMMAGAFEIAWAVGMKLSEGFTRPVASSLTLVALAASFGFLVLAVRDLPIGTAYAVWTGTGAAGVAIIGMLVFGEPAQLARILFLGLIICGIVGLKLTSAE